MASVLIESLSNLLQVIYVVQCSHELKKNWCIIIFFSQATNLEIIYAFRRFVCGEKIYLQSNFRMKKFSNISFFQMHLSANPERYHSPRPLIHAINEMLSLNQSH